jgi:hypothetical protein
MVSNRTTMPLLRKYGLALILASTFLSGCGVKRFYAGPAKNRHEIAVLRDTRGGAIIVNIDNASSRPALVFRSAYELLPGPHTIEAKFYNGIYYGEDSCFVEFEAKAGTEYQLIAGTYKNKWGAYLRTYANGWSKEKMAAPIDEQNDMRCNFK